jgi:hypothetical protein
MNSVAARLTQDHRELETLLLRLAQDARAPMGGVLQPTWTSFESKLLRHFEAEERFLLPLLEASDAAEVTRIRTEHSRIRDLLAELGVAVELHTVREANVSELISVLQAHAKHENAALYRLAGEKASTSVERGIARLLKQGAAAVAAMISNGFVDDDEVDSR